MSHTALYRKKRPITFADVVGQQHVIKALSNQVVTGQVSHAYLFCGTRGTGKTSIARILARAINCESPDSGNPCNTCETCESILAERNLNAVEIDAASNNGVENIRELREEVKFMPTQGKYKVYIIDEVHMLSTSAFNALLKTLEEPPPHVIFILATTDTQKLPATILSRCQRYDFRRIATIDMIATLKKYLQEADVEYEEKALDYIAYHSDGAMRDALSLLDQSISFNSEPKLTYTEVLDMLGAVDKSHLFELTDALATGDSKKVIDVIGISMDKGRDASQFVSDLIRHFRDVLVSGMTQDINSLNFSEEIVSGLRTQYARVSSQLIMEYIHVFSETLRDMKFAPHPRTAFEVCALKICSPRIDTSTLLVTSAEGLEKNKAVNESKVEQVKIETPVTLGESPKKMEEATLSVMEKIVTEWDTLCNTFPNPMRSHYARCGIEINEGKLEIITNCITTRDILKPKEGFLREKLADKFNLTTPPNLAFVVREGYNKVVTRPINASETIVPTAPKEPEPQMEQQAIPADWANPPAILAKEAHDGWDVLVSTTENSDVANDWDAIGIETTAEDW